jgi:hypothetical protein
VEVFAGDLLPVTLRWVYYRFLISVLGIPVVFAYSLVLQLLITLPKTIIDTMPHPPFGKPPLSVTKKITFPPKIYFLYRLDFHQILNL